MKVVFIAMSLFVSTFFLSGLAFAETGLVDPTIAGSPKNKVLCQQAREAAKTACTSNGFVLKGHSANKGLIKDCMMPLSEGKDVVGVKIDDQTKKNLVACADLHKNKAGNGAAPVNNMAIPEDEKKE